jgi:hypothetical protein
MLSQYGSMMDYPVSAINKALFGIQHPILNLESGHVGLTKRNVIVKSNGTIEDTGLFLKEEYNIISGVIYSNQDILNVNEITHPEKSFVFVENPNAKNRLSAEFPIK